MVEFVNASQAQPNLNFALRQLRIAIEENPECTRHMRQGVLQLLRSIYYLIVSNNMDHFIQPPQREFERKINRLNRWILQWGRRDIIDNAIENVLSLIHI